MRRIVPVLTVLLLLAAQITGCAQTMHRLILNYTGMSFGGNAVSGPGPVTGGSRISVLLKLDVPDLRVNITTHDRNGRATEAARGAEPAITSPSNVPVYLRGWRMTDGVHYASEQNAILEIRSFIADIRPGGQIRSIFWDISARSFEPEKSVYHPGDRPTFTLRTASAASDASSSNFPNGGNSATQSGPRVINGTWRAQLPTKYRGASPSPWNPPAPSNTNIPNGFQQFRTIPNGSKLVFRGTKVFIQDASGNLTVPPDGKYRPFNNNYILVVRGGEKFTANN